MEGTDEQARAFMLGLADVHPGESDTIEAVARIKMRLPAKAFLPQQPAKLGNTIVTLQYARSTEDAQITTVAASRTRSGRRLSN